MNNYVSKKIILNTLNINYKMLAKIEQKGKIETIILNNVKLYNLNKYIKSNNKLIHEIPTSKLAKNIQREYNNIVIQISLIPKNKRSVKIIKGTGGLISVNDLIAYQIGWGTLLLGWYHNGIKKKEVIMPGDGFNKWNYVELAQHFYKKYFYTTSQKYDKKFYETVTKIIKIVDFEEAIGRLNIPGLWPWTILKSGKKWPLAKWIQINTVAPYKKAIIFIKSIR